MDVFKCPKPSFGLSVADKRIYTDIARFVWSKGKLEEVDNYLLTQTAVTLGVVRSAAKLMDQEGLVQTFENGVRQISPEYAIFRRALADFEKLAAHFGLSPKIREKMIFEEEREADILDQLIGG